MKKENNLNLEIGERVRAVRNSMGLSREKMSEMLDISALFLGFIECGQRGMSLSTLQRFCLTFSVSADYILLGKTSNEDLKQQAFSQISDIDEKYLPLALENINMFKKLIALANNSNTKKDSE